MKSNKMILVDLINDVHRIFEIDDFNHPFYKDLSSIIDADDCSNIGFSDGYIFLSLSDYKCSMFLSLLEKYEVEFSVSDITYLAKTENMNKIYPDVQELTPNFFDDFRMQNTTLDDVLDKINNKGIDCIDDIDRKILEN